jgi:hypothetical protein
MKAYVIGAAFVVGGIFWMPSGTLACYTLVGSQCLNYGRISGYDSSCTSYCGPAIIRGKKVNVIQLKNGDYRIERSRRHRR